MRKSGWSVTPQAGANLGDRHAALAHARQLITERIGPILAATNELETPAWGVTDQPDFLNQVLVVDLGADAGAKKRLGAKLHALLDRTQAIERELGRKRKGHWGPRTCDIDLIFLDDLHYEDERVSLPHPWWSQRDFVGGLIRRELAGELPFPGSY
ncbi:MAG: 2-amino-4-hydroxy-6-hydroxymethyldihydropteridine diphosphokinase [Bacteroidota bacterium]